MIKEDIKDSISALILDNEMVENTIQRKEYETALKILERQKKEIYKLSNLIIK